MDLRRRTIAPVVGGVTAAATAVGAFAPATQVAVAAPDHTAGATSPLGLAQEGVFEACSAYFGFGKDDGTAGIVGFDVADVDGVDGDDPTAHAVPDDVDVVLVIENDEGDVIECVPDEVTEEDWDDWNASIPFANAPSWPPDGPVRYAYPTVSSEIELDGFGPVASVGFRVVGVPTGHVLVSPTGVQPLVDHYPTQEETNDGVPDPAVLAIIESATGTEEADEFAAAVAACDAEEPIDGTDDELQDAVAALIDHLGLDDEVMEVDCFDVWYYQVLASFAAATVESYGYIEPIRLSIPAQETTTTSTTAAPTPPPAGAQPVTAAPTYTG